MNTLRTVFLKRITKDLKHRCLSSTSVGGIFRETNGFIGKDPDAGKDLGQEEKGTTELEMVGWHHQLKGISVSKLWEIVKDREAWRVAVHRVTKSD